MSYLCQNTDCREPVYRTCTHHTGDNSRLRILECGHFYHNCCLTGADVDQEFFCQTCRQSFPSLTGNLSITRKTDKEIFERHYYTIMRDRHRSHISLPLQCFVCGTSLHNRCLEHSELSDNSRLVFLDCGHVYHVCCLSKLDTCQVCLKSPISPVQFGKLTDKSTEDKLATFYKRLYCTLKSEMYFKKEPDELPDKNFSVDQQKRYCRCILHVAEQQPEWCLETQDWYKQRDGKKCYNPYAICTKSLSRRGSVECFLNYNLDGIPDKEIRALILLKKKLLERHGLPLSLSGLRQLQSL